MIPTAAEQALNPAETDFQTEQVLTVVGGHFTHDSYSAFLAPLLPLLQAKLSLSYGLLGSLGLFMQLPGLLNPLIGYLADRVSVRYFVIFAPAVTATLMSCIGLAPGYTSLALLLFAAGISTSAFHAPAPAMVANVSGNRLGTGMGLFMAGGELGRTLGPLITAAAVAWIGLEGIWRLMFVGWVASAVLYMRLKNVKVPARQRGSLPLHRALRVFGLLAWLTLTRAFLIGAVTTFLPTYMNDVAGASLWLAAGALTILEAAGVVGALLAGSLSDRFGRRAVLLALMLVSPLLLVVFVNSPAALYMPLLVLLGISALAPAPVFLAVVQDAFPNDRALANGIFNAIVFLALGLGISLTGVSADTLGLQNAFMLSAVIALLGVPAIFFLPARAISRS